jgi:hypothetical protein
METGDEEIRLNRTQEVGLVMRWLRLLSPQLPSLAALVHLPIMSRQEGAEVDEASRPG